MHWLIITDLDGTLLEDRYSTAEAARALDTLKSAYPSVRMALASSRTFAEMIEFAGHCASEPMLVFENGAGIAWRESALGRPGTTHQQGYEIECHREPYFQLRATLNKARALGKIKRLIRYQTGIHVTTLACGDAPNDREMLKRADHALVFPTPSGGYLLPEGDGVVHAPLSGPSPWLAGVIEVLESRHVQALAS